MENRDRKKNDCAWVWAVLDRPLTNAQRDALTTLFVPTGKAGRKQEDVRLLAYALRGYVLPAVWLGPGAAAMADNSARKALFICASEDRLQPFT